MKPITLPDHTRERLDQVGSALWLVPMEPQPPDGWVYEGENDDDHSLFFGWNGFAWDTEIHKPPHKPGEVLAEATCESVTPLRLSEISEEQARETGCESRHLATHTRGLERWWESTHPNHPWKSTWAWGVGLTQARLAKEGLIVEMASE